MSYFKRALQSGQVLNTANKVILFKHTLTTDPTTQVINNLSPFCLLTNSLFTVNEIDGDYLIPRPSGSELIALYDMKITFSLAGVISVSVANTMFPVAYDPANVATTMLKVGEKFSIFTTTVDSKRVSAEAFIPQGYTFGLLQDISTDRTLTLNNFGSTSKDRPSLTIQLTGIQSYA